MSISKRLKAIGWKGPHPLARWKSSEEWAASIEAAAERLPVGAVLGSIEGEPATVAYGGWVKLGDRGYCPPQSPCLDPFRDPWTRELVLPEQARAGVDRTETDGGGVPDGGSGRVVPAPLPLPRPPTRRRAARPGQLAFAFAFED